MTSPRVPVLMYHKVGATYNGERDRFINVPLPGFARQMRLMSRLGYNGVTFADVVKGFLGVRQLPPRCFAVTFDDGYLSVAEHAAPILARYRFPATIFVVSGAVGKTNEWDRENGRPLHPLIGWEKLRTLQSEGWEIAGHTRTHPHLDALTAGDALYELSEGKQAIEDKLGGSVDTFCYPFGDYSAETLALVRQAGYLGACSTESGVATPFQNPFLLPRVKISHSDDIAGLLYKLHLRPMLPTLRGSRRRRRQLIG